MLLYLLNSISRSVYSYLRSILAFNRRESFTEAKSFFSSSFSVKRNWLCALFQTKEATIESFCCRCFAILFSGIPSGKSKFGSALPMKLFILIMGGRVCGNRFPDYLFGCLVEQRGINTRSSLCSNFQKIFC